jgi:hypothetical protein
VQKHGKLFQKKKKKNWREKMQKPIKKYSAGAIHIAVWENQSTEGKQYNTVTLTRNYKDKNDQWKTSSSFKVNDIPKAIAGLYRKHTRN